MAKTQDRPRGDDLETRQQQSLWRAGRARVTTESDAAEFMKSVGFALRYNATASLPLASMYQAVGDTRRAIELTNELLATKAVIETNVVADRLVLVHRTLLPALYALRIRHRRSQLSDHAELARRFIEREGHASAG